MGAALAMLKITSIYGRGLWEADMIGIDTK